MKECLLSCTRLESDAKTNPVLYCRMSPKKDRIGRSKEREKNVPESSSEAEEVGEQQRYIAGSIGPADATGAPSTRKILKTQPNKGKRSKRRSTRVTQATEK